ncbi:hypothetical protein [Symbioplanes lichenis]|uniref:hypothetical protein n=1 Tax=Symbioplanes lichenis TaxID=1629072 RepID=UPI0027393CDB|nr:hypothetical protein [Actinoplanes lichenis]
MVPDSMAAPQFRAENAGDQDPVVLTADHSDEAMLRLRHPFQAPLTGPDSGVVASAGSVG